MKLSPQQKQLLQRSVTRLFALEGNKMPFDQRIELESIVKEICKEKATKKTSTKKKASPKKETKKEE
jgi:hypothetical protein